MTMYAMVDDEGFYIGRFGQPDPVGTVGPLNPPPIGPYTYHVVSYATPLTGATPTSRLRWNDGAPVWTETLTLDEMKVVKTMEINEAKWKADQTSFVFAGKAIQADPHSMLQIQSTNGIILLTGSVPSAATRWKTLDNEYVDIPDKATWTQFYAAMVMQGSSNFDHAQSLKAQLAAATSPEAVANIKWA